MGPFIVRCACSRLRNQSIKKGKCAGRLDDCRATQLRRLRRQECDINVSFRKGWIGYSWARWDLMRAHPPECCFFGRCCGNASSLSLPAQPTRHSPPRAAHMWHVNPPFDYQWLRSSPVCDGCACLESWDAHVRMAHHGRTDERVGRQGGKERRVMRLMITTTWKIIMCIGNGNANGNPLCS